MRKNTPPWPGDITVRFQVSRKQYKCYGCHGTIPKKQLYAREFVFQHYWVGKVRARKELLVCIECCIFTLKSGKRYFRHEEN